MAMTEVPPTWDETVPLMGTFEVHWSVTLDEDGQIVVFVSPYQQLPDADREEGEPRTGTITSLYTPLVNHDDQHVAAAALIMSRLAIDEWIKPHLSARIAVAMREQRERQGGYIPLSSPYIEDQIPDAPPEEPEDG